MRKEYDLTALTVKRRGPVKELQAAARPNIDALKKSLLKDKKFLKAVAEQIQR